MCPFRGSRSIRGGDSLIAEPLPARSCDRPATKVIGLESSPPYWLRRLPQSRSLGGTPIQVCRWPVCVRSSRAIQRRPVMVRLRFSVLPSFQIPRIAGPLQGVAAPLSIVPGNRRTGGLEAVAPLVRFLSPSALLRPCRAIRCSRHPDGPASALRSIGGGSDFRRPLALAVFRSAPTPIPGHRPSR